ncbi:uncharacterized protein EKO05_0005782 [Ascochyta rabiei]|uniref:uncharacterized protein n=1 Tax=Didymella rabiei TaxID=5454 RepID=UPI0022009B98|nr:uncharacterized protein EKO05_0005782 [Ascochyta rabiei]UPX15333.1 hypothetical protein EKO05_0005782 [Ascochyta rabiei]
MVPSSLVTSAIEPSLSSILGTATSIVEIPLPLPMPSGPETTATLATSAIPSSLSISSGQPLPGGSTAFTPVNSGTLSTSEPTLVPWSQSAIITSSTRTSIQSSMVSMISSGAQIPTSSLLESTTVISDVASMSSLSANLSHPGITAGVTPDTDSSVVTATSSSTLSILTESEPLLSETRALISSISGVVSTEIVSLTSTGSSPVASLSLTVELPSKSSALVAISSKTNATGSSSSTEMVVSSLETRTLSSATYSSEVISSFLPSETAFPSVSVATTSASQTFINTSQDPSSPTPTFVGTQPSFTSQSSGVTSNTQQLASTLPVSESQVPQNQTSILKAPSMGIASSSTLSSSVSVLSSLLTGSRVPSLKDFTSLQTIATGPIPTSESSAYSSSLSSNSSSSGLGSLVIPSSSGASPLAPSTTKTIMSLSRPPFPSSSAALNGTQSKTLSSITPGIVTATFSTVYVSSIRSSTLDLSTIAFSLLNSVTNAAANNTDTPVSRPRSTVLPSATSGTWLPTSESLQSSRKLGFSANSTRSSPARPSLSASTGLPRLSKNSTIGTTELGITFSRSALPTGITSDTASAPNATQAETMQTSSELDPAISGIADLTASITPGSDSSIQTDAPSYTLVSGLKTASTTGGADADNKNTLAMPHTPTSTPSQTATAGNPPPLTASQTAGIAVGGTTCLLIAVVAAIYIARRYHAAKHGKRMSTGSVYPKVAYLYDPKTGGGGSDAEALMSGTDGGMPPADSTSRAAQGSPKHMQRHSTGTVPFNCFTNPGNPFGEPYRDPTVHRYSEFARCDTTRALSAAVAGYANAPRRSSSYTKYQSNSSNPFSDHVIPSPTFAPFSPDDIRRPELKRAQSPSDGRGDYSQMSVNPYAYLNTAASMYPPISPYRRPVTQGLSPTFDTRRRTMDSDPFADPFEHDVLLQVDERNRTSDSVTILAPSPNLMSPRTPRTPVGPKLPVRQPNGVTPARSLLSPVAAQYFHKAQKAKIPRKSIASPVLVQVGRSPVINPFAPLPAAPEPLGWEDFKRHSDKHFLDEQSVPAPLKFSSPAIKKKPVPSSHTHTKSSLTGAGQALLAGNGLPLTAKIPRMYNKSVGLDVPRVHGNAGSAHEDMSSDPVVREKRSRELRFADPALIGKEF